LVTCHASINIRLIYTLRLTDITDPQLEARLRDVVGLLPESAREGVVLYVDDKS